MDALNASICFQNKGDVMKARLLPIFLFAIVFSCANKRPEIKRISYYDCCYDYAPFGTSISTFYEFYFLVKNPPADIQELHDYLKKYADEFLSDEVVAQCKEALFKKSPGKSKKVIELRFFRVSLELPWDIDDVPGKLYYHPHIEEGNPRDWIGVFRYDCESKELLEYYVWKRKGGSFYGRNYGQIIEEFTNKK